MTAVMVYIYVYFKRKWNSEDMGQNFSCSSMRGVISLLNWIIIFKYFLNCLVLQCYSYGHDTLLSLICIINIFSITFLSLDNQQNNKLSPDLKYFPISMA